LGGKHAAGAGGIEIVMAREVEESVDPVEGELRGDGVAELRGPFGGDRGADQDLSVGEGDDVGRSGDAEKHAVDSRHAAAPDHRTFNEGEVRETTAELFGNLPAHREGGAEKGFQERMVVGDLPLPRGDQELLGARPAGHQATDFSSRFWGAGSSRLG